MKMPIQKSHMLAVILFPLLVAGCTQVNPGSREPVSREEVVANLRPILDMEQRVAELTLAMRKLPLVTNLSPQDAHALKEHYDVYYVYHNAAATSLAEGDFEAYRNHVRGGLKELDSMEAKLKDVLEKSSGDHRQENPSGPHASSNRL
jgi:hypothetical protein